ncbi:hypothetical protein BKA56DRAFT_580766 [Ilyonectria sp. MPI-CAGE-AT-0026]|nr:hypothetical protein BKA56DRAFT_580766 [Ilyonectria sp. MPI-CAGE-AT-0026]
MKPNGCVSPSKARPEGERRWSLTRLQPTLCTISPHSYFSYSDSKSNGGCLSSRRLMSGNWFRGNR